MASSLPVPSLLAQLRVDDLKAVCVSLGLKKGGNKPELQLRVKGALGPGPPYNLRAERAVVEAYRQRTMPPVAPPPPPQPPQPQRLAGGGAVGGGEAYRTALAVRSKDSRHSGVRTAVPLVRWAAAAAATPFRGMALTRPSWRAQAAAAGPALAVGERFLRTIEEADPFTTAAVRRRLRAVAAPAHALHPTV